MTTLEDLRGLLPEGTAQAWPKVAAALPTGAVLMGGTALAVWLRHRRSEDLDFFVSELFDGAVVATALSGAGEFAPTSVSDRMIRGTFDAVKVDIVAHPGEFRLGPPRVVEGLHVGSLEDIAAAKYKAITDRKQLRDFIDVMCVERDGGIALEQGLILHCRKHGVSFDLETVRTFLRHLGDFRYLDDDPAMHATFGVDARQAVMAYLQRRVPQVTAPFVAARPRLELAGMPALRAFAAAPCAEAASTSIGDPSARQGPRPPGRRVPLPRSARSRRRSGGGASVPRPAVGGLGGR